MSADAWRLEAVQPVGRFFVVEWMVGTTCNYKCSYCPPRLHDGKLKWADRESVFGLLRALRERMEARQRLVVLLTGGEPTLYPRIGELLQELRSLAEHTAILTNLSPGLGFWKAHREWIDVVVATFHPEHAAEDPFMEKLKLLSETVPWVQVSAVKTEGEPWARAESMLQRVSKALPKVKILSKPRTVNWERIAGVSVDEEDWNLSPVDDGYPLIDAVRVTSRNQRGEGRVDLLPVEELLRRGKNKFGNWECAAGRDSLVVRGDVVLRANCGVGGPLLRTMEAARFFSSWKRESWMQCPYEQCTCIGDLKIEKRSSELQGAVGQRTPYIIQGAATEHR